MLVYRNSPSRPRRHEQRTPDFQARNLFGIGINYGFQQHAFFIRLSARCFGSLFSGAEALSPGTESGSAGVQPLFLCRGRAEIYFCNAPLGQFTRNYTQTVKRAADNKRRYAPGWVHSTCLLRGFPKGAAPHLAHDFAKQSVVCYTLCRRCPENTVAAGEGKGI